MVDGYVLGRALTLLAAGLCTNVASAIINPSLLKPHNAVHPSNSCYRYGRSMYPSQHGAGL